MSNNWRDLKTDPPTRDEYCVLLFPCITDCGILYTVSNPEYAKYTAPSHGYTHWCKVELAPTHDIVERYQKTL